jgi:hypothetical protein
MKVVTTRKIRWFLHEQYYGWCNRHTIMDVGVLHIEALDFLKMRFVIEIRREVICQQS